MVHAILEIRGSPWFEASGAKLIIGKGGMSPGDYMVHFEPVGTIYLSHYRRLR